MGVSYKKLFKLLIDRNLKKKDLQEKAGLSSAQLQNLQRMNMYVSKFWLRCVTP